MKRLALGLAVLALLGGCDGKGPAATRPQAGDREAGKAFAERECKGCHGLDGRVSLPPFRTLPRSASATSWRR